MKKILILGLVLFMISCSSDDEGDLNLSVWQQSVDLSYHVDELNKMVKENECYDIYSLVGQNGHGGVYAYKVDGEFLFFDKRCPVEIFDRANSIGSVYFKRTSFGNSFDCNVCKSIYSGITLGPNSGRAKTLGLHLIKYQATISADGMYHITNPNYKE